MAYLGNDLQVAYPSYKNIDDISGSFNSSTTSFPLRVSGAAPVPPPLNSQQCLISVGGVVQRPDDSGSEGFRLSGGNIIFASAPATGADFFGVILAGADYVNAGGAFPTGSGSVPSITFAGDTDTGLFNYAPNEIGFGTGGVHHLTLTTAGQLANNSGSAAAPSYSFTGDLNTGIYRPAADTVAVATNGTGRLFINSSGSVGVGVSSPQLPFTIGLGGGAAPATSGSTQSSGGIARLGSSGAATLDVGTLASGPVWLQATNVTNLGTNYSLLLNPNGGSVGIGTTSPGRPLEVNGIIRTTATGTTSDAAQAFEINNSNAGADPRVLVLSGTNNGSAIIRNASTTAGGIQFQIQGGEVARIDSSGRLLVGTSTALATRLSTTSITPGFQVKEGGSGSALLFNGVNTANPATIYTVKSRGTAYGTIVQTNDTLFRISAAGDDGIQATEAARIEVAVDGTPGTNDMPGRIVLSTTSDGASSPTERMRITNAGRVGIGQTSPATTLDLSGSYGANITAVAALDIDCSAGNYFTKTINGNSTFTVSNVPASRNYAFTLELEHTSGSITWFSGVEWPGGTAPTLTTGKTHLFIFQTDNGGTRWRASSLTNYTT